MSCQFHFITACLFVCLTAVCRPGMAQDVLVLDPVENSADSVKNASQAESFSDQLAHAERIEIRFGSQDVSGVIGELSSVHISDNGSRLQKQSFAYRGSAAQDIVVRYRGVPINALSDASADLTLIPGELMDSADVYAAGMTGASGAVGGLVDLNARTMHDPLNASIFVSSLRDFSLFGRGQLPFEHGSFNGAVFGDKSPGRFPYVDAQGSRQVREHNGASDSVHSSVLIMMLKSRKYQRFLFSAASIAMRPAFRNTHPGFGMHLNLLGFL